MKLNWDICKVFHMKQTSGLSDGEISRSMKTLMRRNWFHQDGAPPHTVNVTIAWFPEKCEELKWNGYLTHLIWTPHPDFFLWGIHKGNIYQDNPLTTATLNATITERIQATTHEEYARVINSFAFGRAFSWTAGIWSIYSKPPLEIFRSNLNGCRS